MPTFVLLAGLAAEIYFLTADLSAGRAPASFGAAVPTGAPVAELVSRQRDVRVQNEGELVWEDARAKQTLYRRQSLLTLDGARAEVAFLDGTGLSVDEKSLVVLEKTPGDDSAGYQRLVVRLLHGTLHKSAPRRAADLLRRVAARTPEIEIDAGETRIELTPDSELSVTADPEHPEASRVVVRAGEVRLNTPGGAVGVKAGEEARLPRTGSREAPGVRKLPFALLGPRADQAIDESGSGPQPVRFRWNAERATVAGHPQEIEVSRDPEFRRDVIRSRIPAAEPPLEYVELNLELKNPPGGGEGAAHWYWRVRAVSPGDSGSEPDALRSITESFWIRPAAVPRLRYPAERAAVIPGQPVDLAWESLPDASGYDLEVAGQATRSVTDSVARVTAPESGSLRWRVRARLSDGGISEWSAQREISVRSAAATPSPAPPETPPPPPEELEEPEIRPAPRHSSFWDWLIPSAYADDDASPWIVHLKWRAVPGVKRYRIQIARDRGFQHIISEAQAGQPAWDWNFQLGMENTKGRAFFRVASVSDHGVTGTYSKPKPIPIPHDILTRKVTPETFSAREPGPGNESAGPIDAADAAEHGDLATLAQAPATPLPKHAGKLIPEPKPASPPPGLQPPAKPIAQTRPSAELASEASRETQVEPPSRWSAGAALHVGFGSQSQHSSASDLHSVGMQSPYLQQKLSLQAAYDRGVHGLLAEAQLYLAGFHAPDSGTQPSQTAVHAWGLRVDALYGTLAPAGAWQWYYGLGVDRAYRWSAASDGLSVLANGAFSVGPALRAQRSFDRAEAGFALDVPLTGGLSGGPLGPEGRVWGEWSLTPRLGLRAEAEASYLRWSTPDGTGVMAWALWIAPTYRF